jgi:hypothetical protein
MLARLFIVFAIIAAVLPAVEDLPLDTLQGRWSEKRINDWYADQGWLVGANYVPRTAINAIEMWQAETFDPSTIEQELSWAAGLGLNTVRVFLHDRVWAEDADGFFDRLDTFLDICQRHRIRPLLVLFNGAGDPHPYLGSQRPPRPHVHNSAWVQSPSREVLGDSQSWNRLRAYVKDLMHYYARDRRVLAWDLYNEPDNLNPETYAGLELPDKVTAAHALLAHAWEWAREVNPRQPITAGIWRGQAGWAEPSPIFRFILANADFLSFHNYGEAAQLTQQIEEMQVAHNRPLVCTAYLARGRGSTLDPHLGIMKQHRVGAYFQGLVEGRTQAKYPWASWREVFTAEPEPWHQDILRADGSPYRTEEVEYIRELSR